MVCSNIKFGTGHNFLFSEKTMGYIQPMVFCQKQAQNKLYSSLKALSLSFHKFRPPKLKLWLFKDAIYSTHLYKPVETISHKQRPLLL